MPTLKTPTLTKPRGEQIGVVAPAAPAPAPQAPDPLQTKRDEIEAGFKAQVDWINSQPLIPESIKKQYIAEMERTRDEALQDVASQHNFETQNPEVLDEILRTAREDTAENRRYVDENLAPRLGQIDQAADLANAIDSMSLGFRNKSREELRNELDGIAGESKQRADDFNEWSADAWDQYDRDQRGLNDADRAVESRFMQETNPLMSMLKAKGYVGDVVADQESLGLQRDASNFAKGAQSGALDYRSQAAQAYADPNAVRQQQEGIDLARQDIESGDADQRDVFGRILADLDGGDAEQREVMGRYKELSGPEVTAQERFLGEIARRGFESGDKSSRDAQEAARAARGLRSAGGLIAAQQAARQQLSQDRVLAELGMNANAVARGERMMQGWSDSANQLRADKQQGLGMAGDVASDIRGANQQGIGMYLDSTGQLREQTFDEAFGRGSAADDASANNQSTRFAGGQLAGSMATSMRDAADRISLQNQQEKGISQRFQDEYAQAEADRVGGLANDRQRVGAETNKTISDRTSDVYDANQDMLDTNYGREDDARAYAWDASTSGYDADQDYADHVEDLGERNYNRRVTNADTATGVAQTRAGINSSGADRLINALGLKAGDLAFQEGLRRAKNG